VVTVTSLCEVCGTTQRVAYALVRWKLDHSSTRFENLARCVDRVACRQRVESSGHEWLLDDRPVEEVPS